MDLYEGGIRMAFLARWPGKIIPGTVSDLVSVQYDMLSTVKDLVNSKAVISTDGISMVPTLLGKTNQQRKHRFLYFEYPENGGQVAIRYGNWKAIKLGLIKNPNARWQLYHLLDDSKEKTNLSERYPKLLKKFNKIVQTQHTDSDIRDWNFLKMDSFK
jgi:arylsulfatase A